jgi:hypothetical protein
VSRITPTGQAQVQQWLLNLKLSPALGSFVARHISSVGQQQPEGLPHRPTPEEQSRWVEQKMHELAQSAGSEAKAKEIVEKAKQAVALGGEVGNISATLVNLPLFYDKFLLTTLANHMDSLAALDATLKKRGGGK